MVHKICVRTSSTAVLLGPHTRTRIFLAAKEREAAKEVEAGGAADAEDPGFRKLAPAIT